MVIADFQAAFLQKHMSLLCNMIVYGGIKIYRNNIETLHFLERLRSTSTIHFAP